MFHPFGYRAGCCRINSLLKSLGIRSQNPVLWNFRPDAMTGQRRWAGVEPCGESASHRRVDPPGQARTPNVARNLVLGGSTTQVDAVGSVDLPIEIFEDVVGAASRHFIRA